MKDGWTVQIVPRDGESTRTFRVSPRALAAAAVLAAVVAVAAGVWAVVATGDAVRAVQLEELRAENRSLSRDLDEAERRTRSLARTLDELSQREERFRLVAGLPLIDPDVREVGVGGPATEPPRTRGEAVGQSLDRLLRRARLLSSSVSEATDSLRVHREVFLSRPSIRPVVSEGSWISSAYSRSRHHPLLLHDRPHTGIDISARKGSPILASARGTVTYTGERKGYGKMVEIDHGYGYRTRYAHAAGIEVRRGERVERGDVIGRVGETGLTTGPNLHYEVLVDDRPVNPRPFLLEDRYVP